MRRPEPNRLAGQSRPYLANRAPGWPIGPLAGQSGPWLANGPQGSAAEGQQRALSQRDLS
jgi:hypothetical protein